MRTLLFCLMVIQFLVALPVPEQDRDCTALLAAGSDQGVYQLWLHTGTGEQLIHNNLTPDRDGIIRVSGLPQPQAGQSYRFHMIGAGEGQTFDPVPKNAEILRY